jgi:hypothetical protein
MNTLRALGRSLRTSWTDGSRVERAGYVVGGLLLLSGLVHLVVLVVSGATWTGPVSLRKAMSFGLSFGLTLATVVWVAHFLRLTPRTRAVLLGAFTVTSIVETTLVSMQAWRGVPSHFNFSTPFDTGVSMTLAFGGFVIVATAIGLMIGAVRAAAGAAQSMRMAVRFGFGTLLVALAVGAAMIATGTSAGRENPAAAYTAAGFGKPAHAVFMHAILVVPAIAWLLTHTAWAERTRVRLVALAAHGYAILGITVLIESLTDVPPLDPPVAGLIPSVVGLGLLAAAGVITLYGVFRRQIQTTSFPVATDALKTAVNGSTT